MLGSCENSTRRCVMDAPFAATSSDYVDDETRWMTARHRRHECVGSGSRNSDAAGTARSRCQANRRANRVRQWSSRAEAVQKMMEGLRVDDLRDSCPTALSYGQPICQSPREVSGSACQGLPNKGGGPNERKRRRARSNIPELIAETAGSCLQLELPAEGHRNCDNDALAVLVDSDLSDSSETRVMGLPDSPLI